MYNYDNSMFRKPEGFAILQFVAESFQKLYIGRISLSYLEIIILLKS